MLGWWKLGEEPRLPVETGLSLGIGDERFGDQLEGDIAPEARVAGAPDLAHASRAERSDELEGTEAGSGLEVQGQLSHSLRARSRGGSQ